MESNTVSKFRYSFEVKKLSKIVNVMPFKKQNKQIF